MWNGICTRWVICCVQNVHSRFYPMWFEYRWDGLKITSDRKSPPPHGYAITKGSAHVAATREFVRHALTDRRARDLLDWMSDIKVPDEHFFQTLNHNPQLSAPGAFRGTFAVCRGRSWGLGVLIP